MNEKHALEEGTPQAHHVHEHNKFAEAKLDSLVDKMGIETEEMDNLVHLEYTAQENRRVLRKIDMWLIPVMGCCYFLQFLDKLSLSHASLLGLLDPDVGIVSAPNQSCDSRAAY
jgi:hypothetical protein